MKLSRQQTQNIRNTVTAWREMGIDIRIMPKNVSKNPQKIRNCKRIFLNGYPMTWEQFAQAYPYAANPSV